MFISESPTYSFLSILPDFEIVAEYLLFMKQSPKFITVGEGKRIESEFYLSFALAPLSLCSSALKIFGRPSSRSRLKMVLHLWLE